MTVVYNAILCRYSEIGTKGRNRPLFEQALVASIRRALPDLPTARVGRGGARICITPGAGQTAFTAAEIAVFRDRLPRIFGLVSASPALLAAPELAALDKVLTASFPAACAAAKAGLPGQTSPIRYAMRARRNNPAFAMSSHDLEVHFAEKLLPEHPELTIDLRNPQLRVDIEIHRNRAFVSYERIPGPGGLPSGTGGRLIAMLSGGIDSPVACYQMMRRGCTLHFVTFHSSPYTPPEALHKVARLAHLLRAYQGGGILFAVNLVTPQKAIRDACSERFRTVLYRRMMVRICEAIAGQCAAQALCTGDNLGQVASQTLSNMACIDDAAKGMILRPLVAMDKDDIMAVARSIGTFGISAVEMPDSCTVFAPQNPATNAPLDRILAEERRLDIPALVGEALAQTTVVDTRSFAQRPARWDSVPLADPPEPQASA